MSHIPPLSSPEISVKPGEICPISAQSPCGPHLEYDPDYAVLLSRLAPRGDAQYGQFVGNGEAPDWADVERDCRRLLLRTIDITLLVWLCRARTRLGQASGLAQVLATLSAALDSWPEDLHPRLVVEGEFDPAVRANALAALADPDGLLGDVREIVVASNTAARLTVCDVERAFAIPRLPDAPSPESVTRQLAALRLASRDSLSAVHLLAHAAQDLRKIDAWCQLRLANEAPSLLPLQRLLDRFADPEQRHDPMSEAVARQSSAPREATVACSPGPIISRNDARKGIRATREWFEQHEPSSPVAVLLKQAERMVGKRFSQVAHAIPLELLQKWEAEEDVAL
jgi:type VI secretion system protein ImpA